LVRNYLDIERHWRRLARHYQFAEQLENVSKGNNRTGTRPTQRRRTRRTERPNLLVGRLPSRGQLRREFFRRFGFVP
jgi:hypothetical protein